MPPFIGPERPLLQGPPVHHPCDGMHFDAGSPHHWVADRRHDLDELCDQ